MPLFDFCCGKNHQFERVVRLMDLEREQRCECGEVAVRLLSAPMVAGDLPGYESPVSGRWIEGRAARRDDLRRNNCRPYEAGEKEGLSRRKLMDEARFDASIEATVEAEIERMPLRKREKLAGELEGGLTAVVERSQPNA